MDWQLDRVVRQANPVTRNTAFLRAGLLAILVLAAGLRWYRLDAQSFWNDEGNSARLAERGVRLILEGAAGDIHPPLYYLALHYWRALAGQTEFALRAWSAMGGIGLVALIYAVGSRLLDAATGLVASFLAAINPFQVYYSQEARAYIWVALLGSAAVYSAWRLWESDGGPAGGGRPRAWAVAYLMTVTAGLYTHYLFAILLVPPFVVGIVHLGRQRQPKLLGQWVLLHLLAGLFFAPWAPVAVRQLLGWPSTASGLAPAAAAQEAGRLLALGPTIETAASVIALVGFGLLLMLGLIPETRSSGRRARGWFLIVCWLVLPVALVFALNLYKPAFAKFLLIASPPLCLLLGRGLTRFALPHESVFRTVRFSLLVPLALSLGLILSFSYESLLNLYFDPAYARADYRGIARTIQSAARPGDAIILNAPNQWEVFTYYYPQVERTYPLPRSRPANEPELFGELEQIAATHDRIYAILWAEEESDPRRLVERWLDAHAYKANDNWWGDVRLVTYAVPTAAATEVATPVEAQLGESVLLRGFTLLSDQLTAGDIIQITFFWEALAPMDERYKVFLHLLNHDGALVAQQDSEPGGGSNLTTTWEPGKTIADNHGVLIPVDAPSGEYQLICGLYPLGDPSTRLPVGVGGTPAGGFLTLAPIQVSRP